MFCSTITLSENDVGCVEKKERRKNTFLQSVHHPRHHSANEKSLQFILFHSNLMETAITPRGDDKRSSHLLLYAEARAVRIEGFG